MANILGPKGGIYIMRRLSSKLNGRRKLSFRKVSFHLNGKETKIIIMMQPPCRIADSFYDPYKPGNYTTVHRCMAGDCITIKGLNFKSIKLSKVSISTITTAINHLSVQSLEKKDMAVVGCFYRSFMRDLNSI